MKKRKTLLDSYMQERKIFDIDVRTKVFKNKKKYNRKDKKWRNEDE